MNSKGSKFDPFSVSYSIPSLYLQLIMPSLLENRTITVSELKQVAQWQGLDMEKAFARPGAFLLVRTGVTQAYHNLSSQEQIAIPYRSDDYAFIGMEASEVSSTSDCSVQSLYKVS